MLEEELVTALPRRSRDKPLPSRQAGLARISEFLGHADPKTTMRYLRHLRGNGDETWEGKMEILGIGD